jgi:hypothetical protein
MKTYKLNDVEVIVLKKATKLLKLKNKICVQSLATGETAIINKNDFFIKVGLGYKIIGV